MRNEKRKGGKEADTMRGHNARTQGGSGQKTWEMKGITKQD